MNTPGNRNSSIKYFVWPPWFVRRAPSLLGMELLATYCNILSFSILQEGPLLEPGCWMESDGRLFRIHHRCSPIGFRSGDILGHWIPTTWSFFRNATVALDVCFGSLSCWKSARWPRVRSYGSNFSFNIQYSTSVNSWYHQLSAAPWHPQHCHRQVSL